MMLFLKKILFLVCVGLLLIPGSSWASGEPQVEGIYIPLPTHAFKFNGKQVEVMEFLSFYCGHCYHFESDIPVIRGGFPRKTSWKVIPIYWGNGSSKPGEAYLLAEEAGKGDKMKAALFQTAFVEKLDIGKVELLEKLGTEIGLGFDFSKRLRAGEKTKVAQQNLDMAKAYGVNETPTLVIAGSLMTSPSLVRGGDSAFLQNVNTIIGSILK
ncbi:MAG: DsbA family protein [Nitrospirae bacterium]|nr:DsbA family protein [Nitrospirota bacterium]